MLWVRDGEEVKEVVKEGGREIMLEVKMEVVGRMGRKREEERGKGERELCC